jgi:hypothetical protein
MAAPRGKSEGNDLVGGQFAGHMAQLERAAEKERERVRALSLRSGAAHTDAVAEALVKASFGKLRHRRGNAF